MDRRHVLLGAVIVELCLGMLSWTGILTATVSEKTLPHEFTAAQTETVSLITFSFFIVFVVLSPLFRDWFRPERIFLAGGLLIGAGQILVAFFGYSFAFHLLGMGLMTGAGAGLVFLVPFIAVARIFSDGKGTALGIAASGYALGPILLSRVSNAVGSIHIGIPGEVQTTRLISGILLIVVFTACRNLFGTEKRVFAPLSKRTGALVSGEIKCEITNVLKSKAFVSTAAVFLLSATAVFLMIEHIRPFAIHLLTQKGMETKLAARVAELCAHVARIMIAVGCVLWGFYCDRGGMRLSIFLMNALLGAAILCYPHGARSPQSILLFSSMAGLISGGIYVLFLMLSVDRFGEDKMGTAYALFFSAFGIAALAAPIISVYLKESAIRDGDAFAWAMPFYVAGAACIVGAVIVMWVDKIGFKFRPRRREKMHEAD